MRRVIVAVRGALRRASNRASDSQRARWRTRSTSTGAATPAAAVNAERVLSTPAPVAPDSIDNVRVVRFLKSLLLRRRIIMVKQDIKQLRNSGVQRMPYSDYTEICERYGLTSTEAEETANSLEKAMFLVQSRSLMGGDNKVLYLQPRTLIQELLRTMDPDMRLLRGKVEELKVLEARHADLDDKYTAIVRRAVMYSRLHVTGLTTLMAAKFSFFAYLVYSEGELALGWDIMEPVTYLYGVFWSNLAIMYISIYGIDFNVADYVHSVRERRIEKLCESRGFDRDEFNGLRAEIQELKLRTRPPEACVMTNLPIDDDV